MLINTSYNKKITPYINKNDEDIDWIIEPKKKADHSYVRKPLDTSSRYPLKRFNIDQMKSDLHMSTQDTQSSFKSINQLQYQSSTGLRKKYSQGSYSTTSKDNNNVFITGFKGVEKKQVRNESILYGKNYVLKKHYNRKTINCMAKKYMSTSLVEIARGISRDRKRTSSRIDDSEVDNKSLINSLRNIHLSNYIIQNIKETDKHQNHQWRVREDETEKLTKELNKSLEMMKEQHSIQEKELREKAEKSLIAFEEEQALERELAKLRHERDMYANECKQLETEEQTLEGCKRFLEEKLLTKEMKDSFEQTKVKFWNEQIMKYSSILEYHFQEEYNLQEAMAYLQEHHGVKDLTIADSLHGNLTHLVVQRYQEVFFAIQNYVQENDRLREVIDDLDEKYAPVEEDISNEIHLRKKMLRRKTDKFDSMLLDEEEVIKIDEDNNLNGNYDMYVNTLNSVNEWIATNSLWLTNGVKNRQGEASYNNSVDIIMAIEQMMEIYIRMVKEGHQRDRDHKDGKDGSVEISLKSAYTNIKKERKKKESGDNEPIVGSNGAKRISVGGVMVVAPVMKERSRSHTRVMQRSKPFKSKVTKAVVVNDKDDKLEDYLEDDLFL